MLKMRIMFAFFVGLVPTQALAQSPSDLVKARLLADTTAVQPGRPFRVGVLLKIAPQWHFRPPLFANAYVVARNEIYLMDEPAYYRRMHRTLDESLAHEFAHYLQVTYFAADLQHRAELQQIRGCVVDTEIRAGGNLIFDCRRRV